MKIKSVSINRRKKSIEILVGRKTYSLPFSRLELKPTENDRITTVFVDPELAREGITYRLSSGKEDSVPLWGFLDYNRDPDFMRMIALHKLSVEAVKALKNSKLSKNEVCRRLSTSPSQLARLLDTANYKKSVDEMLRLLATLGCDVSWEVKMKAA